MKSQFGEILLNWSAENPREMPWSGERDPYKIWLSEIILQQTRVEQGLPYYIAFTQNYPTVTDLANADIDAVLLLWQGLGYYSRARNLHAAAQHIRDDYEGIFPADYKGVRAIKGVGDYTAAAICSFAYDLPYAVVDGNVYRVLSRIFGIHTPIDTTEGKHEFRELAQSLLATDAAAAYNQAIMNFGAMQCTPKLPNCKGCPFATSCVAFKDDLVTLLPNKIRKIAKRTRFFNFLVLKNNENIWVQQRGEKDIWQGLYQFPLIETDKVIPYYDELVALPQYQALVAENTIQLYNTFSANQLLTHQRIEATFWIFETDATIILDKNDSYLLVEQKKIANFAFPKVICTYLERSELVLTLNLQ